MPLDLKDANELVMRWHRHHKPVIGHKFSIGVAEFVLEGDWVVHGVAICGRPVARLEDRGLTLELTRLATDGTRNACSILYRASWRAARELGYERLITYTLPEEGGASLRGAGFKLLGQCGGGSWSRETRPRIDKHPLQKKIKWEISEAGA